MHERDVRFAMNLTPRALALAVAQLNRDIENALSERYNASEIVEPHCRRLS